MQGISSSRRGLPLISIILCTYNRAHLVTRAIASVLGQSCGDWELIIVDDGSIDDTALVMRPLVKSDPRLRYLYQANQGLARSRNAGITLARGTYTTFLDSDDEFRRGHLTTRIRAMMRRPSVTLLHGGIEYVGPVDRQYVPDAQRPGKRIHLRRCYAGGTFFARTSLFRKFGGFRNLPFAMDLDFVQRVLKRRLPIARIRTATYRYHLNTDHRMCDLYEGGGEEALLQFRRRAESVLSECRSSKPDCNGPDRVTKHVRSPFFPE